MTPLVETRLNRMLEKVGSRLGELEKFFGCPIGQIDTLCLKLALHYDLPEWLRSRPAVIDLPRRSRKQLKHFFYVDWRTLEEQAEFVEWVVERTHGPWALQGYGLWFDSDEDAVLYRLTFN